MADWICPRCRRSFVQRNARHSCARQTLATFFAGRPGPYATFKALRAAIGEIGATEIAVTKSQISFRARTRFAWAWLPQRWLRNAPEEALVVTFDLDRQARSPRIKQAVEVRPGRWTHHVVLLEPAQIDAPLLGWLRRAYALATSADRLRPATRSSARRRTSD